MNCIFLFIYLAFMWVLVILFLCALFYVMWKNAGVAQYYLYFNDKEFKEKNK